MTNVREKVVDSINNVLRPERPDLTDHSKPLLSGVLDSLDFASLLMSLEDEFNLGLTDEDMESVGSIDKLVAFIESKQQK